MKIQFNSTNISGIPGPGGIVGKGCGTLFFGLFFAMGMLFVVLLSGEALKQAAPWWWTETDCTIVSSAVATGDDDEHPYRAEVRYLYEINGREFEGDQIRRGEDSTSSFDHARDRAAPYQPGAMATCRFDPEHPALSVLERRIPWIVFIVLFPLIFVAIGIGGLYATWRGGTSENEGEVRSISQRASFVKTHRFLIGLGLLFIVVGGLVFAFLFAVPAIRTLAAGRWEATPGTIIRSTTRSWSTDDGTSYRADVLYEYAAHGRTWQSNRVTFFSALSSGRTQARAVRDRYPAGTDISCWVDPENPARSVLDRGFHPRYLLGLLPLLFVIAGAAVFGLGWKQRGSSDAGESVDAKPHTQAEGPVVLKPQRSPVGKLAGTIFFALFWNGIVSVFAWQAWMSWERGHPDWFLSIFLIPFVLIGIAAFAFIGHFALALANPRPRITLQRDEPSLGDELRIEWHFTGRSSRLSHLHISLEGQEEATYRRGTDTHTDREVFKRLTLIDTGNNWEIPRGTAEVSVPDDTMHSFAAASNKVIWELKVVGEILRWPDVNQNFPITLHPLRLEDV